MVSSKSLNEMLLLKLITMYENESTEDKLQYFVFIAQIEGRTSDVKTYTFNCKFFYVEREPYSEMLVDALESLLGRGYLKLAKGRVSLTEKARNLIIAKEATFKKMGSERLFKEVLSPVANLTTEELKKYVHEEYLIHMVEKPEDLSAIRDGALLLDIEPDEVKEKEKAVPVEGVTPTEKPKAKPEMARVVKPAVSNPPGEALLENKWAYGEELSEPEEKRGILSFVGKLGKKKSEPVVKPERAVKAVVETAVADEPEDEEDTEVSGTRKLQIGVALTLISVASLIGIFIFMNKMFVINSYSISGVGKYYYSTGTLAYEGEMRWFVPNGKGKFYSEEGLLAYEGEVKSGKQEGMGTLYNNLGQLAYEGDFKGGLPNGEGKRYTPDGLIQEGQFENGAFVAPTGVAKADVDSSKGSVPTTPAGDLISGDDGAQRTGEEVPLPSSGN